MGGRASERGVYQPGDGLAARGVERADAPRRALVAALGYLALGHALAVFAVMLPFGLLAALLAWQTAIRIGASALVIGFGAVLLIRRRHPRALARIPPARLGLWSFAVAIAHGAG